MESKLQYFNVCTISFVLTFSEMQVGIFVDDNGNASQVRADVQFDESCEDAVKRKFSSFKIEVQKLQQLGVSIDDNSATLYVHFLVFVPFVLAKSVCRSTTIEPLYSSGKLSNLNLVSKVREIVASRGLTFKDYCGYMMPARFTMSELVQLYEGLYGVCVNYVKFKKKVERLSIRRLNIRARGSWKKRPFLYEFAK